MACTYKTILIATDLSDPSYPAVTRGADLAQRLGSEIVLTYVIEGRLPAMILAQSSKSEEELLDEHRAQAEQALRQLVDKLLPGQQGLDIVVRQGSVHDEIARLARERGADLIVVGMHGHGFLQHALAGSTAERVLHVAECPVLVVPQSED